MGLIRKDSQASLLEQSEGSALRNVFGSEVSLAELNGDVPSTLASRSSSPKPYTRSAVSAETRGAPATTSKSTFSRPVFDGLTPRSRRYSVPHQHARTPSPARKSFLQPLKLRANGYGAIIVFVAGAVNGILFLRWLTARSFDTALGLNVTPNLVPIAGALALCAMGLSALLPLLDAFNQPGAPPPSPNRQQTFSGDEWASLVRATGMVLGLTYALSKVSGAWLFWGLANPCLWYLADRTRNGLFLSLALSAGLTLLLALVCKTPGNPSADQLSALAAVAAAIFSVVISFGNLGRRLFVVHSTSKERRR